MKNQKGFTLIELLIVIVIIGILAGVLIAVIDPGAQQNRARDANVQATMNKTALASEAFNSAYGRTPEGDEFINALGTVACVPGGVCKTGTATFGCRAADVFCMFEVSGNVLPVTCGNSYTGTGANPCYYRYEKTGAGTFQLYAKSFGLPNTVFGYNNAEGRLEECTVNGNNTPTCP